MQTNKKNRPFLKWPGGKYRLLNHILPHLPQRDILIEPFLGAGALALNYPAQEFYLNDINSDLINLYLQIKNNYPKFLAQSQKLFQPKYNGSAEYYKLRQKFNTSNCKIERSQLFFYLNRHGFNGLCRYNSQGIYNVPFGRYKQPYYPGPELEHFKTLAKKIKFFNLDFEEFIKKLDNLNIDHKNSVIYCDPPYAPLSKTANFTNYFGNLFDDALQLALANWAKKLAQKGAFVMLSNHDTPFIREIYQAADIIELECTRVISSDINNRNKAKEILAIF